ncbi:hypothetical protein ACQKWADRAFT_163923 [Trichoderma austrokoningii]
MSAHVTIGSSHQLVAQSIPTRSSRQHPLHVDESRPASATSAVERRSHRLSKGLCWKLKGGWTDSQGLSNADHLQRAVPVSVLRAQTMGDRMRGAETRVRDGFRLIFSKQCSRIEARFSWTTNMR